MFMRATPQKTPTLTVVGGRRTERERFAAIVQPHYESLYRVAYRLTRSAHDAEDLAQEVCARAFPRLDELEQLEQPRAWLLRVLYRLYIDLSRRYERRHVGSIEDADGGALVCDRPTPVEEADRALDRRRLARAWQYLDEQQRALLALHDVEGYSLAELHELTGLKEGTLKSRLHRARVRLGKFLQRDPAGPASRGALGSCK
jgi:RNA polymerase sigma-70 factor (ECF subfamily)